MNAGHPVLCRAHPRRSHARLQHQTRRLQVVGSNRHHDSCRVGSSRARTGGLRGQVRLDPAGEVEDVAGGEERRAAGLQAAQERLGQLLQRGQITVQGPVGAQLDPHLRKVNGDNGFI